MESQMSFAPVVIMTPANRKWGGIRKQQLPQEGGCSDERHLFINSSELSQQ